MITICFAGVLLRLLPRVRNSAYSARVESTRTQVDMEEMSTAVRNINSSGREVQKIMRTIDEIAFQANLLALNAAAEAAEETAARIGDSISSGSQGETIARRLAGNVAEIVGSTQQARLRAAEIRSASVARNEAIGPIRDAVAQINKVIQAGAASSEQTASTAEQLHAQANTMHGLVNSLVEVVAGSSRAERGS
ncbi:MAG TPA: methyl-accepting chemotaxis protein [Bryobacteraceae bacterium]|nr:methyl-accepting chemotaxis protein [Bryobacteraceae bacterium]